MDTDSPKNFLVFSHGSALEVFDAGVLYSIHSLRCLRSIFTTKKIVIYINEYSVFLYACNILIMGFADFLSSRMMEGKIHKMFTLSDILFPLKLSGRILVLVGEGWGGLYFWEKILAETWRDVDSSNLLFFFVFFFYWVFLVLFLCNWLMQWGKKHWLLNYCFILRASPPSFFILRGESWCAVTLLFLIFFIKSHMECVLLVPHSFRP